MGDNHKISKNYTSKMLATTEDLCLGKRTCPAKF